MRDVFLILGSVLLNCAAQLLMRRGMLNVGEVGLSGIVQQMGAMLANLWLWAAMVCFLVSVLLWMSVLSRVEVGFAYSQKALHLFRKRGGTFLLLPQGLRTFVPQWWGK